MAEPQILAALDLGSNSFHMLIVRVDGDHFSTIDELKEPVRLRMGLKSDGTISQDAIDRAIQCLSRFAQRLGGLDAEKVRIVGTNTLRRARNAREFVHRAQEVLKLPIEIIGGSEEARLVYLAVALSLPESTTRNLVVDIGGSSTEIIIGVNMEQRQRESRSIGCVAMNMEFFPDNLFNKKRFQLALLKVKRELEPYRRSFSRLNWDRAIGCSGTIKSIGYALGAAGGKNDLITREGLQRLRDELIRARPLTSQTIPGLREDRVPVFLGGFAVLYGIFEELDMQSMDVSSQSLREGVLYDMLGRSGQVDKRLETVRWLQRFYSVDLKQSERIKATAQKLFTQIMGELFHRRETARRILECACDLHEIGLAIGHSGFHKHSAYVLQNGDLDGFSQTDQGLLSFLVLNSRKRLKTDPLRFEEGHEWPLVFVFRLACILHRERIDFEIPDIGIGWRRKRINLNLDSDWLKQRPLTNADLEQEQSHWRKIGFKLYINDQPPPEEVF